MSAIVKGFQKYAMPISDDVKTSDGKSCHAQIVAAQFIALCYIIDQRYFEGAKSPQKMREAIERMEDMQFVHSIDTERLSNQYQRNVMCFGPL